MGWLDNFDAYNMLGVQYNPFQPIPMGQGQPNSMYGMLFGPNDPFLNIVNMPSEFSPQGMALQAQNDQFTMSEQGPLGWVRGISSNDPAVFYRSMGLTQQDVEDAAKRDVVKRGQMNEAYEKYKNNNGTPS